MTLHPASLLAVAFDLFAIAALARSLMIAFRIELSWNPQSSDRSQLSLERKAEEMSFLTRYSTFLFLAASLVALWTVNHSLPPLVRGAMCGVGVLQNMPDPWSAIATRLGAALALTVVFRLDQLNRQSPTGALTRPTARAVLVSFPIVAVSAWQAANALLTIDTHKAVSCCAAVYDLGKSSHNHQWFSAFHTWMIPLLLLVALAILALALIIAPRSAAGKGRLSTRIPLVMLSLVGVFCWLGSRILIDLASPYVYGLLAHRCPMCLFLPRYFAIGYLQYGALAILLMQTLSLVVISRLDNIEQSPALTARSTLRGITIAVLVFLSATFGPILLWRIRFGMWM